MRGVHPGSWWGLALAVVVAAGFTRSPLWLLGLSSACVVVTLFVREKRVTRLRTQSLDFYLWLAVAIVLIRVAFRIVFNLESAGSDVLLDLPAVSVWLGFGSPVKLFGAVSAVSLAAGFVDGLRLACIVLAVGMANLLANPRRLLKSTPGVLFEIATTVSVAINLAPQLIVSLQRVRRARALRGRSKGVRALSGLIIPVLEDTLDRSLALAASMDSRGFGRFGTLTASQTRLIRLNALGGTIALGIATYLLLASNESVWAGLGVSVAALAMIAISLRLGSMRNLRTRYATTSLAAADFVLAGVALVLVVAALAGWLR